MFLAETSGLSTSRSSDSIFSPFDLGFLRGVELLEEAFRRLTEIDVDGFVCLTRRTRSDPGAGLGFSSGLDPLGVVVKRSGLSS